MNAINTYARARNLLLAFFLGQALVAPATSIAPPDDEIALVGVGHIWNYYVASHAPPAGWYQPEFNDEGWTRRPSGFSSGPVFGLVEATLWPLAVDYNSAFLRTRFDVPDASQIQWLVLRVEYSDGFVAYLNGHEVARRGLPNQPVAWNDAAEFHPEDSGAEELDLTDFREFLQDGSNTFAMEVHNSTNSTPAAPAAYSLRLLPELLANFTRGPYIQNLTTNSVQVIWRTLLPSDSVVEYGLDEALGSEATDLAATTNHVLTLVNLVPGTRYWYRIRSSSENAAATSALKSFRTFQTSGPVTFFVIGDSGGQVVQQPSGVVPQYALAELMNERSADLVIHCGDVIYPHFTRGFEDLHFLSIYRPLMASVPVFAAMANHDLDPTSSGSSYLETFYLPTNSATGTEHFYSFDHGDVHFVSLFVPDRTWGGQSPLPGLLEYALTNGSTQYNWLTNDLASSAKPWKIIFLHVPVNDSGNHRFDDDDLNGVFDRVELQDLLMPIASRYGVQLIFSGHDHDFEKFNPVHGVYTVVSGGGGGPLPMYFYPRTPHSTRRDPGSSQFWLTWHFLTVSINEDTLRLEAIGTNGVAFDSMTIRRTPPPAAQLHDSTWHTPLIETIPANDDHGNLTGQTFDFVGTPLLTPGGEFSNLGRVFVNNDATNLYIGFEQVMLNEDNNIFLLLDSPHEAGVSNLVGLGDGEMGTDQGVDGLDFLENLDFTDFTPHLAVLVGDEYGDGNDRLFSRPALELKNIGQGVFRLDSTFSTVDSARIQQFNRSPQQLEPTFQLRYPEQDANYIEIAIPFSELGDIKPGETIRIGAVVGGPAYDSETQGRQLDTAFLGDGLVASGMSNASLKGLAVRLALDPAGDDDFDGLPNSWEEAHGLNPNSAEGQDGASGDPDDDGMNNLLELLAGTDPEDPASVLRLHVDQLSAHEILVSWPATIGRRYQLEVGSDPLQFTNHPNAPFPITTTSNAAVFVDELSNCLAPVRFYRVRVVP